jgi:hypothetical protein
VSIKRASSLEKPIREIAHCFVKNHLRISVEPSEWYQLVKEGVLDDPVERRVIAIVGSGASKAVGLPLAAEALEILKEEAIIPNRALEAELDRLSQIYKLERGAFETCLRALSTSVFEAQKLRDSLQNMYSHRYMPILGYEILAHMLKHRFLDAIINFNFDELLDQAIEDELDPEEYYHILSDGDCPDEIELKDTNPELPFYIKPHGTASHKSTLRFTREDYYGLPLDIQRILRYLITDKPVVLLVIGFGMQSLEFNHILEDAKQGSMMFHINKSNPVEKTAFTKFNRNELLGIIPPGSISDILKIIWERVSSSFRNKYRPRGIERHILVARTFSREIKKRNVENYLRGRTVIELCLSVAKGKGLVTMSQLSEDRSGKYFDDYKAVRSDANFYEMCRQIGLKDIGYSREAMRLMKEDKQISKILDEKEFRLEIDFLYSRVQNNLDPESRNQLSKDIFRKTLLQLYKGQEVELRYHPHNPYTKIFRFPKPIPTYTTLKFFTDQIFKQDWEYLFLVAETGEWLTEDHIVRQIHRKRSKNPNIKIYLIVADMSWEQELRKKYGKIIAEIKGIPWWEHNRHMTILVNSNRAPLASIYFSRRLRSANITPVLLDNIDDSLVVLESFNAYWLKAPLSKEDKNLNKWISSADVKDFVALFDPINKKSE